MATCKDCLHCEACTSMLEAMGYTVDGDGLDADKRCDTFKQREGVIIALTSDQWETVRHWLQYGIDYHAAKRAEWLANCKNGRLAAEYAEVHEKAAAEAAAVYKLIDEKLYPPTTKETE